MGCSVVWGTKLLTEILIVLTTLVLPLVAVAQRPGHVPRIAVLELSSPPSASEPTSWHEAFRHGLRERGWVEGHTIAMEWRWAEGGPERFAALVAEVLRLQVAVLVVPNSRAAMIAKQATSTIPIVVVGGGGLVENGLVASLARPGGNVTGLATLTPQLTLKHLELLKEAVPGVTRVAVLQALSSYSRMWPKMEATARSLGMELQLFEVREPTAFDSAFTAMTQAQADALMVLGDPFFTPYLARIAALAIQHRLPSIGPWRRDAEAGYLMGYGTSVPDHGQRIAAYVDKILKGATPADLPVEQPMKFELVINLKTAQALGLPIPPTILFQANEVIR
jgi:putative tryptophan/tyrosine transport system substrate-binding protein